MKGTTLRASYASRFIQDILCISWTANLISIGKSLMADVKGYSLYVFGPTLDRHVGMLYPIARNYENTLCSYRRVPVIMISITHGYMPKRDKSLGIGSSE